MGGAPPVTEKTPSKRCNKLFLLLIATCLTVASRLSRLATGICRTARLISTE